MQNSLDNDRHQNHCLCFSFRYFFRFIKRKGRHRSKQNKAQLGKWKNGIQDDF